MADKRLAEENQSWMRNLRREVAKLQELVTEESVRCTREQPEVDWAYIEKLFEKAKQAAVYGRQCQERAQAKKKQDGPAQGSTESEAVTFEI